VAKKARGAALGAADIGGGVGPQARAAVAAEAVRRLDLI